MQNFSHLFKTEANAESYGIIIKANNLALILVKDAKVFASDAVIKAKK